MPVMCRWAQLPLEVVLAVCQGLSERHIKRLKDDVKRTAKFISCRLDSLPEGVLPKKKQATAYTQALTKLYYLENDL